MKRKILLKGKCCQLTKLEKPDLFLIKNWRNEQRDILRQNKILTDKDQINWYKFLQYDQNQKIFSIVDESGILLGYCGITNIDWINRRGELSFLLATVINKDVYAKILEEVIVILKQYFFSVLHLHKFFTETFEFRKDHITILEKSGFVKGGVLKDHVYKNGKFYNSLVHYIIR